MASALWNIPPSPQGENLSNPPDFQEGPKDLALPVGLEPEQGWVGITLELAIKVREDPTAPCVLCAPFSPHIF